MPSTLDPLAAADRIAADYRAYLATTFAPLTDDRRADFEAALGQPSQIRKGPYLQATPPYLPGASLSELAASGHAHADLLAPGQQAVPTERPLYRHQEEAIRRISGGENLIVATGTGSGKTECYLLPILSHLLAEREAGTLGQPGVRAMLLYPMNALANDQMKRLRELFAAYPEITFGRYIGDTAHTFDKAREQFRQQHRTEPQTGELIDRATMQQRPPHVLLTNFAMLEYLLLRPADSSLFDGATGRHWRFVVLDEVHVYDGAKGAEVAMLLRRVRDRTLRSQRGVLRCIGTSATLGSGPGDTDRVLDFARKLFDEPFSARGVVHPQRAPLRAADASWAIDEAQLVELHGVWARAGGSLELAAAAGRAVPQPSDVEATLWQLLHDEQHVIALQSQLESASRLFSDMLATFDDFDDPARAIVMLVDLCVAARHDAHSAALLPARYHLWLRSSEGAFVCHHDRHPAGAGRVQLDRHATCPACAANGIHATMFELAVCRHCRREYLVGKIVDSSLTQAAFHVTSPDCFVPGEDEDRAADTDEDEDAVAPESIGGTEPKFLCAGCGVVHDGKSSCGCASPSPFRVTEVRPPRQGQVVRKCITCKRSSNAGVVQRFVSGSEASVAVLATSLYQSLPPSSSAGRRASADGRKLLMFSDSRQDAAFFAPYLDRTYRRAVERSLLWSELEHQGESCRFDDLVQPLRRRAELCGFLDEDAGAANRAQAEAWLLAEVLATDRRQSLDGLGLARIEIALPRRFEVPSALRRAGFDDEESLDLVRILADTLRQSAAVSAPNTVDVRSDTRFGPRNTVTVVREAMSSPGVLSWLPGAGQNRRTDFMTKVCARRGSAIDPVALLRELWRELTDPDSDFGKVLAVQPATRDGVVFALNHSWLEFCTAAQGADAQRCDVCRQVWWRSVSGACPTYRCDGTLQPTEAVENHYTSLYRRLEPLPLRVEEHTGQLRSRHAADLQEQFVRGELNALSCSTTFELGVDVGEVQAVLLRNVPPSAANYVQRAGRAGRRLGSAALVTAFAQRRSHDRSYFQEPTTMIDGVVPPPSIMLDNDAIVRRHVHAVAWAHFERERVDRGESAASEIGDLIDDTGGQALASRFVEWLQARPEGLRESLTRLVPHDPGSTLAIDSWGWVDRLISADDRGVGGWLTALVDGTRSELAELQEAKAKAAADEKYKAADSIDRTMKTIVDRPLLNRFAQTGVLPKYGFPVDVAELDVVREPAGRFLDLNRDLKLGILEFAPGASVVAKNHLWVSKAIKQPGGGRKLPEYEWSICTTCSTMHTLTKAADDEGEGLRSASCRRCQTPLDRTHRFVIPLFGFVGAMSSDPPGESRPPREGHLETFFTDFEGGAPDPDVIDLGGQPFVTRSSRRGWITVINRGRTGNGFRYCSWCGYADDVPARRTRQSRASSPPGHPRPTGNAMCKGTLRPRDLGHRFMTNVIEIELPGGVSLERVSALSTLHALIGATPVLGILPTDIGGSLSVGASGRPALVLFDDVPGGAGHTRRIRQQLEELIRAGLQRVQSCTCGEDTSCYGCLRSYRNQFDHDDLTRAAAVDVLNSMVRATR